MLVCVIVTGEYARALLGIFIGTALTLDLYHYRDCEVEKRRKKLEQITEILNRLSED